MPNDNPFPRDLSDIERRLLLWILPEDRPGYYQYRTLVEEWSVVAQGRRGEGNYILAPVGEEADIESPLPQVLAYGVVETERDSIAVTIRERVGNQVEYEIVGLHAAGPVSLEGERRRWSFSRWSPGMKCVICGSALRQVAMVTDQHHQLTLALCSRDRRMWVYDALSQVNHIIPPTIFYNELMLHKSIRDPKIALDWRRLFSSMSGFSDAEFIHAFRTYNQIRMKVPLRGMLQLPVQRKPSLFKRLAAYISKP
jgi:hypothetical protein